MATAMYAWTDINNSGTVINAGDKVSKGDFSDEDWEQLVEARSVRTTKYPDLPAGFAGSPREFMVQQINKQLAEAEEMLTDDDVLAAERSVDADVEEG